MDESWFDPATGLLRFDEIVMQRPTFQKIMQDGVVTPEEFREQTDKVHALIAQLEPLLSSEAKGVATDAFAELAVLFSLLGQVAKGA